MVVNVVTKTYTFTNAVLEVCNMTNPNGNLAAQSVEHHVALKGKATPSEATRWNEAAAYYGRTEQCFYPEQKAFVAVLSSDQLAAMTINARDEVWPTVLKDMGDDWV
jgi:hypothetical protein